MCNINLEINLPGSKVIKTEKDEKGNILITVETTEDHVSCRICNKKIYKRHGIDRERKLNHLPAFGNHTFIVYSPHRYVCEECQDNPTTTAIPS
jgi:transposase